MDFPYIDMDIQIFLCTFANENTKHDANIIKNSNTNKHFKKKMTNKIITPQERTNMEFQKVAKRYKELRKINPHASHHATCLKIADERGCTYQNVDYITKKMGVRRTRNTNN